MLKAKTAQLPLAASFKPQASTSLNNKEYHCQTIFLYFEIRSVYGIPICTEILKYTPDVDPLTL
jgi:hypothetical protein